MKKLNNRTCGDCNHFYIDNITANCEKLCLICNDDNPACKYFEPKTNGDRIRAMSDEELAELIVYYMPNVGYSSYLLATMERTKNSAVAKTVEELKKEVEE